MPRAQRFTDGFEDAPEPKPAKQMEFGIPPSSYALDSDMTTVAVKLVGQYPEALGHIRNFQMVCLRRSSRRSDPSETFMSCKAGHAFVRSDLDRGITPDVHAGVWLMGWRWDAFTPEQRTAWMHHLLLHIAMTPEGKPILLGHDAEGFEAEVRIYGLWQEQLKLFGQGLDSHEQMRSLLGPQARATTTPPPAVN